MKHLENTLEREKDIYERTVKSLSSDNQAALKDMVHEHATVQKELENDVNNLRRELMMTKIKLANMLTTQNTKIKDFEVEVKDLNDEIKNNYQVT